MTTIELPNAPLHDVPLESRAVLGKHSAPDDAGPVRVSFGRTEPVPLVVETPGIDPELAAYLAANPLYRFCVLSFTCSFRPDDEPVIESRLGVRLRTAGAAAQPVAWSMNPERLSHPAPRRSSLKLSAKAQVVPFELGAEVDRSRDLPDIEEAYLVATGKDQSVVDWFFRVTGTVAAIEGMHDLSLVVRAPADQACAAELILAAKIRRRFVGIVPYRATLPVSARRIELPT